MAIKHVVQSFQEIGIGIVKGIAEIKLGRAVVLAIRVCRDVVDAGRIDGDRSAAVNPRWLLAGRGNELLSFLNLLEVSSRAELPGLQGMQAVGNWLEGRGNGAKIDLANKMPARKTVYQSPRSGRFLKKSPRQATIKPQPGQRVQIGRRGKSGKKALG
jgi:hypothetical protein